MKILIIDSLFTNYGGGQIIAYNTYKILRQNGHEVFFWGMDKKPYFEENYEYSKYFTPHYKGNIDYIKNPIKYYYNYKAKQDLDNLINFVNPDIVHIHSTFGITLSILDSCYDIPIVMTLHDAGLICPSGNLMFKNTKYCNNLLCKNGHFYNCLLNKCNQNKWEPSIRRTLLSYINKNKIKKIHKFITPSNALMNLSISANIGITADKILTINNFLTNNDFQNIQPNYDHKGYFLYAGRLSKEKGVHYLIEAMKDLYRDIELHIVGKGPDEEKLKQYSQENELDNVKFLGFKNREEIKEEYQNCIATILPCNWFENFPTTNMESFINGKPVIASNIGGIPEQIEHNKTGLLFEPANVEQLKKCILQYWNNKDLVIEHGKNAYEKAKTQYTEERYYRELIQVYEEIIRRR